MALFDFLIEKRASFMQNIFTNKIINEATGGWFMEPQNSAGISVTENNSMRFSAVYGCLRVLTETLATTPIKVYKRKSDGSKKEATDHPLYSILRDSPNEWMTSFNFLETEQMKVLTNGNCYSRINRSKLGELMSLTPLDIGQVKIAQDKNTNKIYYEIGTGQKDKEILAFNEVFHVPGLGWNGIVGFSPIKMAIEAIGLGLAAETFGAKFFGSGSNLSGVLQHPGGGKSLSSEAIKRMRESWNELYSSLSNSHKVALLEEGTTYERIGVPPEEAQFLETRRFQVEEIARIYRVPLHLLQNLDRATFSNIEQQSLEFIMYTMLPWFRRWEECIKFRLLTETERRKGYFVEFIVDGWLRGDSKSRAEMLNIMRQNGVISANQWLSKENMNPIEGEEGDALLVNGNMIAVKTAMQNKPKAGGGDNDKPDDKKGDI